MDKEFNYSGVEETQDKDALAIIESMKNNGESLDDNFDDYDNLDGLDDDNDSVEQKKDKLLANKYKSVDELKKGIKNIGSTLPDYIIDGMNEDALEKHYLELQKEFSSKDKKFIKNKNESTEQKDDSKDESENKDVKPISADLFNEAESYYLENGGLSEALYDKLEKAGIPSSIVDRHIEMVQKETIAFTNEVFKIAGGQDKYDIIKEWAENGGVDRDELDYISSLKDKNKILGALKSVKTRYDIANNKLDRINGSTNTTNQSGAYKSQDEYFKDVSDKRYSTDELFRKQVDRKLANSKFK